MAKDLEKENKKLKKKNSSKGTIILLLLLVIIAIIALMLFVDPFGLGLGAAFGLGSGTDKAQAPVTSSADDEKETDETSEDAAPEDAVTYIDVTIKGKTYLIDGAETALDDIVSRALEADGKVIVRLSNDDANAQAVDDLKEALDNINVLYELDKTFEIE